MARALWTGSLSFGLVNVPVQLVTAVRDRGVHFHQVRAGGSERVEMRRVAAADGDEVPWSQIAKGWETDDGKMVVLTDRDFASAAPEKTRTIDIEQFVALEQIDPIYFNHPYWLLPVGEGEGPARAYRLLRDAMAQAGEVAIGRIVLRNKEHLIALREQSGLLSLTTMRFADELRDPSQIGDVPSGEESAPLAEEVHDAVALIEEMTDEWDPASYEDTHRARLLGLIESKRSGGEITLPEPQPEPKPQKAPAELIAALQESLAKARGPKQTRARAHH